MPQENAITLISERLCAAHPSRCAAVFVCGRDSGFSAEVRCSLRSMRVIFFALFHRFVTAFRRRLSLYLKIVALRHQLTGRRARSKPPPSDWTGHRVLWSWLARVWPGWRTGIWVVRLRTGPDWQKRRTRGQWRRKNEGECPRRPTISPETRELLRRASRANPTWGSPRIVGELAKLGSRWASRPWSAVARAG